LHASGLCGLLCFTMMVPLLLLTQVVGGATVGFRIGTEAATVGATNATTHLRQAPSSDTSNLKEIFDDLQTERAEDVSDLKDLDKKITALVHQRDGKKRDEKRKDRELGYLRNAMARNDISVSTAVTPTAVDEAENIAAQADQELTTVAPSEPVAPAVTEPVPASTVEVAAAEATPAEPAPTEAAPAQETPAETAAALPAMAVEEATTAPPAEVAPAVTAVEAPPSPPVEAAPATDASSTSGALRGSAPGRADVIDTPTAAAIATATTVSTGASKSVDSAAAKAKATAEQDAEDEKAWKVQLAAKRKMEADADSADDSFKDFMKEEDGEDEQADPAYEDSANALAGAIGWNRKEVESNADTAVKSLTEAIGGKQVVQSVQGMLGGIR